MGKTSIEWTDATWNPVVGCARVSEGCRNCYAEVMAGRVANAGQAKATKAGNGGGLTAAEEAYGQVVKWAGTKALPKWNGKAVFIPEKLDQPLRWRKPRRVFVNSMSDLFHDDVTDEQIAAIFGVMAACPKHTFQVLTKRPERMLRWFEWVSSPPGMGGDWSKRSFPLAFCALKAATGLPDDGTQYDRSAVEKATPWPLPNVWLGVSVEDQATADERIPLLLQCPAAVRWVSAEPLLGPLHLGSLRDGSWYDREGATLYNAITGTAWWSNGDHGLGGGPRLDWVVCGGESGHGARPMHPDWALSLRDQCQAARVAFHFKQWGAWAPLSPGGDDFEAAAPHHYFTTHTAPSFRCAHLYRGGKKAAGRVLDGRTWDEWPS